MEDEDGGLFNIEISSEDEAADESEKVPRDFQSEKDFQRQKAEWKPKIEVGELWKSLKLPVDNPSKPQSQAILHAVEELYFFKRYEEALNIVEAALKGKLIVELQKTLEDYRARCQAKVQKITKY
ncbi:hypothetical protein N431DRAFT_399025 [Stipitochalara longipes BDJ]|nr:hypothetical protein N431DRAFT_399025 [Stipitochalara longipes BDJ]